jgi:hypothetical protein
LANDRFVEVTSTLSPVRIFERAQRIASIRHSDSNWNERPTVLAALFLTRGQPDKMGNDGEDADYATCLSIRCKINASRLYGPAPTEEQSDRRDRHTFRVRIFGRTI